MILSKKSILGAAAVGALLMATPTLASAENIQGMIIGRDGDNMILRTDSGQQVITLTDDTDIKGTSGMFAANRDVKAAADLIPGLPVNVEADDMGGHMTARTVRFKNDHLVVAQQVEAGLNPTAMTVANHKKILEDQDSRLEAQKIEHENLKQRYEQLGEYDVRGKLDVNFDTNSSTISEDGKKALCELANQAKDIKGYLIHISGHADSRGSAEMNQALSARRTAAVTNYIQQSCGVDIIRVLAPDPMGTSRPASTEDTPAGLAANRRVSVEILVNKGLHAG